MYYDLSKINGIREVEDIKMSENNPIFNLQGQRVNKLIPGSIYIQGGKKFIGF